jgi:hypothetical protein
MPGVRVVWLVGRGLEAQAQGDTGRLRITQSGPAEGSAAMEMLIIVLALCLLGTLAIMFAAEAPPAAG